MYTVLIASPLPSEILDPCIPRVGCHNSNGDVWSNVIGSRGLDVSLKFLRLISYVYNHGHTVSEKEAALW